MAAVGCLLPLILLVAGIVIGGAVGGTSTGLWAGLAGFVIGLVAMGAIFWAFERARQNWPQ